MSRMLAAKASLAVRVDAYGEDANSELGITQRAKLERRMEALEHGNVSAGILSEFMKALTGESKV